MKFTQLTLSVCVGLSLGVNCANAGLISSAPVNGLATFEDTSTGLVWLKLSDLFNMDYNSQLAVAGAAGFTVADFTTVNNLFIGSAALGNGTTDWDAIAAIIGSSSSRGLMWGNYADTPGNGSPNAWGYAYSGYTTWSNYNPNDTSAYSDLGLWAHQTANVPEPASILLMGLGLAGIGLSMRKKA